MGICLLPCCKQSTDVNGESELDLYQDIEIPIKDRKQTDRTGFIVLILFFVCLIVSVFIAGSQGDIRRLTHGYDDKGNICGFRNEPIEGVSRSGMDFTMEKYLLIRNNCINHENCLTERVCVNECKDGLLNSLIPQCSMNIEEPKPNTTFKLSFEIAISDVSLCWKEITVVYLLSMFVSGMILAILPWCPSLVKWIFPIAAIVFAILAWTVSIKMFFLLGVMEREIWNLKVTYTLVSAIVATVAVIFAAILICPSNVATAGVKLVPVLFQEGSRCIKDAPMMLLQPLLTHLISAIFTCFMVFGFLYVITSGKAELDSEGKVSFPNNIFCQITTWILFFALFWLSQFLLACQNLSIAGTASLWYFSRTKEQLDNPVRKSIGITVKHHLGSAAFGSLLLVVIRPFQFLYSMLNGRSATTAVGPFDKWDYALCFLRIISKNAYVIIALLGEPFCTSARRAFACVTKEKPIVAFLLPTKACSLIIIEVFIALCTTFVGELLIMDVEGIKVFWIPSCTLLIVSLFCCHAFFSVYNMTIDTIVLCFCVDHQMNDGLEIPYYMNEKLKVLFNEVEPEEEKDNLNADISNVIGLVSYFV